MAKEVSSRNTKAQIYQAYQELVAEHDRLQDQYAELLKEKQALEKRAASQPAVPRSTERQERAPQPITQPPIPSVQTIDGILANLAELRTGFGSAISELSSALTKEASRLDDLRSAINGRVQRASELYGIKVTDDTLDDLIYQYQESVESFGQQAADKREAFEKRLAQLQAQWESEQQEHGRATKERDTQLKTERQREGQEYEYELQKRRKLEAEQYAQVHQERYDELAALVEAKEKEWSVHEQALAEQEAEYEVLRTKVEAFPGEVEAAIKRADKEGTDLARKQAKIRDDLLEKEEEGNRRVADLKIKSLEETVAKQAEQIQSLSAQLDTVAQQSQTLAIRAIEGASRETSFESIREIALEQAKRIPKSGQ